jgi:ribonuclease VapC
MHQQSSRRFLAKLAGMRSSTKLEDATVSSVNVAEVYTYAAINELPTDAMDAFFADTGIEIAPFDHKQAITAGQLAGITRKAGLSLGDRSCLALSKMRRAEVLTADRPWEQVGEAVGLTITLLR